MITNAYIVAFGISFILSIFYVFIWKKHYNTNITAIYIMIPIIYLGYIFYSKATDFNTAKISNCIKYLAGCYLMLFMTFSILNLCDITVSKWLRILAFVINSILYCFVLTVGYQPYFYKEFSIRDSSAGIIVLKQYGPVHTFFYGVIVFYFLVGILAIVYSFIKKKQVSNYILFMLILPEILAVIGYFSNAVMKSELELLPFAFTFAQFAYLFIIKRMSLYNISENVVESMVQTGEIGFISVDNKMRFLGANETAKDIIPELRQLSIDEKVDSVEGVKSTVCHWVEHFIKHEEDEDGFGNEFNRLKYVKKIEEPVLENNHGTGNADSKKNKTDLLMKSLFTDDFDDFDGEKVYLVDVTYLHDGEKKCGYQILLNDDTSNQKYIELLDSYNDELEAEVDAKTKHILEMHNNLILSMATMVESRDNSTGGHIRRTSDVVKMLMNEIMQENIFGLSDEFCKDIIKAAPMHDLGKISVRDDILRKKGRFEPDEYEEMKKHAAEGARIVHEILKDTDDESFKILAENVAHYHHERMDGSGYPEGLVGEEIPLEARIMAVADVYDALVSKRVYKEKFSFEKADSIMMESMGKHFDERLKPYYIKARPKLEAYYMALAEDEPEESEEEVNKANKQKGK